MSSAPQLINYNRAEQQRAADVQATADLDELFLANVVENMRKSRLNLEKNVLLLWVLSQQAKIKRYEYDDRHEWLLENRGLLLLPEDKHDCTQRECFQFSAQPGQRLTYVITGEQIDATGDIYVCSWTGAAHHCPGSSSCSATVIDHADQRAGYYCAITSRSKRNKMTHVEGYNAERPIGLDKLDKKMRAEEDGMNDNYEDASDLFEAHDMDEGLDLMQENEHDKLARLLEESRKAAEKGESLDARSTRSRAPAPKAATRPQRVVRTLVDMTSDERVALHFLELDRKQALALAIVRFVLSFENQATLYANKLNELSERITARVNSQINKARRPLTSVDCDNLFLRYITEAMPAPPRVVPGLYFGRYTNAIMQAWCIVAQSPYARTAAVRKQPPLRFEKIAFGLLYKMAGGGYTVNCALPSKLVARYGLAPEAHPLDVISHDPAIAAAIADSAQLVALRAVSLTSARPDGKTVNDGFKLLENCYRSIFQELLLECAKRLQNGEDKQQAVQAYFDACASKRVPPTAQQ